MAAGSWRARVQLQLPFGKPASPDAPPAPPVAQPAPPAPVPPRAARNGAAPDAPAPKPRGRKRPPAPPPPATSATSAEAPDEPMPTDADAPDDAAPAPVAPSAEALVLEVQVNRRLRRTYRWRIVGERLIVERPERVSDRDLRATLATIRERAAAYLRRQTVGTDAALLARARRLLARYFPERPTLRAVGWSARQHKRHGSCAGGTGVIRLAAHLQRYPPWVVDYVLVHELAHLLHSDHSPAFWAVVNRYPLAERARGFLIACDFGFAAADAVPSAEY
ncbi:MAG TPA: M48 family metallopeptidase [Chloroflexota bacterium]|nr:M48 family metallopeptidase [Chloroflexota bacterium]